MSSDSKAATAVIGRWKVMAANLPSQPPLRPPPRKLGTHRGPQSPRFCSSRRLRSSANPSLEQISAEKVSSA